MDPWQALDDELERQERARESEAQYQLANVLRERASRQQLRMTWFNCFALIVLALAIGAAIWEAR